MSLRQGNPSCYGSLMENIQETLVEIPLDLTNRDYLSYSSFTTFVECGEKYRLKKVIGVEVEEAAWYFTGGSAVHAGSEAIDWQLLIDKAVSR